MLRCQPTPKFLGPETTKVYVRLCWGAAPSPWSPLAAVPGRKGGSAGSWCCWLVSPLCLIPCDPRDCSPPGSSVCGLLQARILEWLAFPPPGALPDPGIEPASAALAGRSLPLSRDGSPLEGHVPTIKCLVWKQPITSTYNAELVGRTSHMVSPCTRKGKKTRNILPKSQLTTLTGRRRGRGTPSLTPAPHSFFELTEAAFV